MFLLVLSALTVTNSLSKKNKASFEYVPSSGAITADSDDFVVLGSGDTRISMKEIAAKVQQLSARPAGPSTDEVKSRSNPYVSHGTFRYNTSGSFPPYFFEVVSDICFSNNNHPKHSFALHTRLGFSRR